MSALPSSAATPEPDVPAVGRLTLLPRVAPRISTLGFFVLVGVLVALGLAAVMVTTTTVAAQSREVQALTREATELGYRSALLTTELQQKSSTSSLAMRASDLGMVPNPYPAFLNLEDGTILGEPTPVKGNEAPWLTVNRSHAPGSPHNAAAPGVGTTTLPLGDAGGEG